MGDQRFAVVVLAAGLGTRMKSDLPKVLHPMAGLPLVHHVLSAIRQLDAAQEIVVIGPESVDRAAEFAPAKVAVQERRRGTADALKTAAGHLAGFEGDVLVAYGDSPLVRPDSYAALIEARRGGGDPAVAILGFRPSNPDDYGRLIVGDDGVLQAVIETRDASEAQRAITLCNSGIMALDGKRLIPLLDQIDNDNAKGEYYLTDIVAVARREGYGRAYVESGDAEEFLGVNSRADLAVAEAVFQTRARGRAMADGVTMVDPTTCFLSFDTHFGRDVRIEPNVFFGPGVRVGDRVTIRAYSHIEGAVIGDDATIGPFSRVRPGTELGRGARIGNFVEVKNARIGAEAKASHLAYVGDAEVGDEANIGAGTITCNYDGVDKYRTVVGDRAFIGSNASLVAPVRIGAGAVIGAGSVITEDVAEDAVATARAPVRQIAGGAPKLYERNAARAAARKKQDGGD
jgi:bifunctional UDP-N-acetylglucosamine pyrophosphorylase/glucosamine-1-phosphate N-acetyltransferase